MAYPHTSNMNYASSRHSQGYISSPGPSNVPMIPSSSSSKFETKYCSLCDKYFYTKDLLRQHLESSSRHPRCTTCERSFLNMNSLRNHYVISSRHNYCRVCEKMFETASGLRVHLEHSPIHRPDHDDDDDLPDSYSYYDEGRPEGWEDDLGRIQDQNAMNQRYREHAIVEEERRDPGRGRGGRGKEMGREDVEAAIRNMKSHSNSNLTQRPHRTVLTQSCPICYSTPRSMLATRCGHLFCYSCIHHAFQSNQTCVCPTCRQPGDASQLRKVDLRVY